MISSSTLRWQSYGEVSVRPLLWKYGPGGKIHSMSYDILEIGELDEFCKLEEEWNLLLSASHCDIPFLRHEWLRNWWLNFGGNNRLAVICIRKNGGLVGAFPLMEVRTTFAGLPFIILQSMTNAHSFRYHFLLSPGEEDSLTAFWQYLRSRSRKWDLLQLEEMPADVLTYEVVCDTARRDSFPAEIWRGGDSPYVRIHGKWNAYWEGLAPKFRSNMRNRSKRLEQLGKLDYEVVTDPSLIESALTDGFAIEQKSWKGEKGTAIACRQDTMSFYTRWADTAAKNGWLRLSFLKVNGQRTAFDYSICYNNRLYCMKIGYDPAFSQYSVGQILCSRILQKCFEDELAEYDFLGEKTTQKFDWTSFTRKRLSMYIYNHTLPARMHLFRFRMRQLLKSWIKK